MSTPEKDFVFALLMLDLKRWRVSMKSIWLGTCPLGVCQVAFLDISWGWRVLAGVSRWLIANSRSLNPLSFVSPLLNLPTVTAQCWYASGLLWHSSRLELHIYNSWESLLWRYQAAYRTVRLHRLRKLRLVHRPETVMFGLAEIPMGMSLLEMGVQLVILSKTSFCTRVPPHAGVSSLLLSTKSCVPHPW